MQSLSSETIDSQIEGFRNRNLRYPITQSDHFNSYEELDLDYDYEACQTNYPGITDDLEFQELKHRI